MGAHQLMPTLFVSCRSHLASWTHQRRFSVSVPKKQPNVYLPPLQLKLSCMLHRNHAAQKMSEVSWTSHWAMFATRARSKGSSLSCECPTSMNCWLLLTRFVKQLKVLVTCTAYPKGNSGSFGSNAMEITS